MPGKVTLVEAMAQSGSPHERCAMKPRGADDLHVVSVRNGVRILSVVRSGLVGPSLPTTSRIRGKSAIWIGGDFTVRFNGNVGANTP